MSFQTSFGISRLLETCTRQAAQCHFMSHFHFFFLCYVLNQVPVSFGQYVNIFQPATISPSITDCWCIHAFVNTPSCWHWEMLGSHQISATSHHSSAHRDLCRKKHGYEMLHVAFFQVVFELAYMLNLFPTFSWATPRQLAQGTCTQSPAPKPVCWHSCALVSSVSPRSSWYMIYSSSRPTLHCRPVKLHKCLADYITSHDSPSARGWVVMTESFIFGWTPPSPPPNKPCQ